ncbi:serine/threonine-protein kinase [Fibrobacteres bacterium R8-0-B4]
MAMDAQIAETVQTARGLIGADVAGAMLLTLSGLGRSGLVFTGFQRSLKRNIAVKLVRKDKTEARSFIEEAAVAAALNHPNIVAVFDAGEFKEYLYITMQLVDGDSLQTLIKRKLRRPEPSRRGVGLQTALLTAAGTLDALAYAHRAGVVHQDVKPGNILIERGSGRPYLADFGIARTELTEKESVLVRGTPLYMPPEQARGEATDARADVFATGVTLWECLSGTLPVPPFPSIKLVGIKARKPQAFFSQTPSESSEVIDKELEAIIQKATASDKEDRYTDCAEFLVKIKEYADKKMGLML